MFKFLKDKLKQSIATISNKIDKEAEEKVEELPLSQTEEPTTQKQKEPKKGFFGRLRDKFKKEETVSENEFKEVTAKHDIDEYGLQNQRKEEQSQLQEKDKEIKEKIERKEIPKLQELQERQEKKEEIKKIEKIKAEVNEPIKEPEITPNPEVKQEPEATQEEQKETELTQKPELAKEEQKEDQSEIKEPAQEITPSTKKGFFGKLREKVVTKKINEKQFDDLFWDLEVALLENNMAVEVIEKIKSDLRNEIVEKPIRRNKVQKTIEKALQTSIKSLFEKDTFTILEEIKKKKPYIICFLGINGSGKTTTIAKVAKMLQNNKLSCVLAASDTFRAASIEQLQLHAEKLGIKLIKHDYGGDPAAVAFDAVEHAKSKNLDVVLIDTAGRMHSNINLIDEMKKIVRVAKPDLKIFVGESITGNDCVEQAKKFDEAVGLDAIILSKADVDEKGGAAISISYVTKKPIIYIGTGQEYTDLKPFDSEVIVKSLGLA